MDGLRLCEYLAVGYVVVSAAIRWWRKACELDWCESDDVEASQINYTPRGDRVIVKRFDRPEPTLEPGQMALPDSQRRLLNEGSVIAVGPEVKDLEPGDHVCFLDFAGTEVEVDGEQYLSMREQEIHGVRKES